MKTLFDKIDQGAQLTRNDLISILSLEGEENLKSLFKRAYSIKEKEVGVKAYFRGIIELSNICEKDCYYCGIRKSNKEVNRFLMSEDEIIETAQWVYSQNYGSLVLQAGEMKSPKFTDMIERVLKTVREKTDDKLRVTLSLGEQDEETYARWQKAGAHRYLLRIETTNRRLSKKVHPEDHKYRVRFQCLKHLREIGYQVGSGVLIGMPEQTADDLAEDALFFRKIDLDMIGMGPYIIHRLTPLAKKAGNYDGNRQLNLGLKMIAVCRLLMPDINIAATTALQTLSPTGWEQGIRAGANVVMSNITPEKYRKEYNLYEGKTHPEESSDPMEYLQKLFDNIKEDIIPNRWGDSRHFIKRNLA